MYNVLVSGADGQLGSELKMLTPKAENMTFLFTDVGEVDITDSQNIEKIVADFNPDYWINCAAYTAVDKAEIEIEAATRLNVIAPGICAEIAEKKDITFIHISTDYVFDGRNYKPYTEEDVASPLSVYGKTKLEGEKKVQQKNSKAIIIRTSWLYSSFGNNFVKTMIRLGNEKSELNVVVDQIGTPTYAADLGQAVIDIIKWSISGNKIVPGIYHYANEGACSWYDFAIETHKLYGIKCKINPIEGKEFNAAAPRPYYSVLNKKKIRKKFMLTIPHWKKSLEICIMNIKKQHHE